MLHGFLVKSCGTLIQRNMFSSSWLIPSKLFESVAYWGLNHHLNSCLFRMPLQTQCIQSIGKLSGMSVNWQNTFSPLMPNTVVPLASTILPNILVSCAVLTATVPEGQYSYSLTCICPSEWLYLPGCLHILQPNLPLCCLIFKSKALAGRCGTSDWILHSDDTSSQVSLLKLLPFAILNNSLVKCFKNNGTCGLDFPDHSPVSRMFSNLYLSWGRNSTRKQISGHWY